jgi:hypothetical protein
MQAAVRKLINISDTFFITDTTREGLFRDRFATLSFPTTLIFTIHTTLNSRVDFYGGRKAGEPGEKPSWQGK